MNNEMTFGALKNALQTDPNFIVAFIVDNNTAGVAENLNTLGYNSLGSQKEIYVALNELWQAGRIPELIEVLNVRYITPDGATTEFNNVLIEVAQENYGNARTSGDPGSKKLSEWGEEGIGIDNILAGIAGALGGLFVESGGQLPGGGFSDTPTPGANGNTRPGMPWWGWVLIIVGIVLLIILIVYLVKKYRK